METLLKKVSQNIHSVTLQNQIWCQI